MRYLLLPLIALDVAINVCLCLIGAICTLDATMLRDSYCHTLSARAGHMAAEGKPWGKFFAPIIDWLAFHIVGQDDHCYVQYMREAQYGGVWQAMKADKLKAALRESMRLDPPPAAPVKPTDAA